MKSPMQKLIEELEKLRDQSDGFTAEVEAYTVAIDLARYFLDEEVDALDEAYGHGWANACKHNQWIDKQ